MVAGEQDPLPLLFAQAVKNQAVAAFTAIQGLAVIRRRVQSPRPLPSRAESFLRGSATAVPPPGPCPYGAAPAGAATLSLRDAFENGEAIS